MVNFSKKFFISTLIIIFGLGASALSLNAEESGSDSESPILAVKPFEYDSGLPTFKWIGEYLSDTVTAELSDVPGLRIIERGQINQIFQEIELSMSGLTEEEVELGGLEVATHLVLGRYRIESNNLHATFKLVQVNTGRIVSAETVSTGRNELNGAARKIRREILKGLNIGLPMQDSRMLELSLSHHKALRRARELWAELPFHELHPRRRRKKLDFQNSVDALEELLMEEPGFLEAYYLTGQFYLQLGREEDAASYFDVLLSEQSDAVRGNLGYGDLHRFDRNEENALLFYNKVLAIESDNPGALYGKAKCLLDMDRYEEAAIALIQLQEVIPGRKIVDSLISVAIDRIGVGRIERSSSRPVYAALAGNIALQRGYFCHASELFDTATAEFPDLYLAEYSNGACQLSKGRLSEAAASLHRAKQLYPTFPPVYRTLGELAMEQKNWQKAASSFRTYMNLSSNGSDFAEIRKKILYCEERF